MTLESGDCSGGLGSRLRSITRVLNHPYDFTISDWVLNGAYYSIFLTTAIHDSDQYPVMQSYEKVGSQYVSVQFDSIIMEPNGDFEIRVLSNPDLRFNGRLILDH
jgi:hypothetical protein